MASTPRRPRLVALYVLLVALLVVSGLLMLAGEAVYALLLLGVATLLNVRMLLLRNRLPGAREQ